MSTKIYEDDDTLETINIKSKELLIKYPNQIFNIESLNLTISSTYTGKVFASCCNGDQCCSFNWDSIDEFLKDYCLHQYQDLDN